jgi:arylsulfatase A-like enzyme
VRNPDVLLVILDCVRSDAALPMGPIRAKMPHLDRLSREGTEYTRAIASSHWTLPSHASILTGLAPWNHRTFRGSTLMLPPDIPTYAEHFRKAGYRTACLSANPFISPLTGLSRGFDLADWGQTSDCFLRFHSDPKAVGSVGSYGNGDAPRSDLVDSRLPDWLRESIRRVTTRFPLPVEMLNQAGRVTGVQDGETKAPRVSGWIEGELRRFLGGCGQEEPVFVMVNLLDAHEPYFGVLSSGGGLDTDWLWAYSGPLDRNDWREGIRPPGPRDIARITRLYRASVELADARLGNLLSEFAAFRDVDRTDVVVLGDHGQALGEQGRLYHVYGTDGSTLRVPLVIRAASRSGSSQVDRWVTAQDSLSLLAQESPRVARVLGPTLAEPHQPEVGRGIEQATALVDGYPPTSARRSGSSAGTTGPRDQAVVAYGGDFKVVVEVASGKARFYDTTSGEGDETVIPDSRSEVGIALLRSAQAAVEQVRRCLAQGNTATEEARLASWGY